MTTITLHLHRLVREGKEGKEEGKEGEKEGRKHLRPLKCLLEL